MYEEISVNYPKANKVHTCVWCREDILKGEKHLSRTYKFDHRIQSDRLHIECEKAMNKTDSDILESGWTIGEFYRGIPGDYR